MSGQPHLVLAEDDRLLRKAAETAFKRCGFRVTTACDGEEALRLVRADRPDAVLLDLIMPKMQGFEVLRQLKADSLTSSIPVIVLSSLGQDQDQDEALKQGAAAFINKSSFPLGELVRRVQDLLKQGDAV